MPAASGESLGDRDQRGGVIGGEGRAGVIGRLAADGMPHRRHVQRSGERLGGRERAIVALHAGVGAGETLGRGGRIGDASGADGTILAPHQSAPAEPARHGPCRPDRWSTAWPDFDCRPPRLSSEASASIAPSGTASRTIERRADRFGPGAGVEAQGRQRPDGATRATSATGWPDARERQSESLAHSARAQNRHARLRQRCASAGERTLSSERSAGSP